MSDWLDLTPSLNIHQQDEEDICQKKKKEEKEIMCICETCERRFPLLTKIIYSQLFFLYLLRLKNREIFMQTGSITCGRTVSNNEPVYTALAKKKRHHSIPPILCGSLLPASSLNVQWLLQRSCEIIRFHIFWRHVHKFAKFVLGSILPLEWEKYL